MGGRWITDILADNDPDDESYFPTWTDSSYSKCSRSF
jgi:hypothetical protein